MTIDVDTKHPDYDAALPSWELCRDVSAGSRAVKAKSTEYLSKPEGMTAESYSAYLERAVLFAALGRTITALCGTVFHRAPTVEAPDAIKEQMKDATLRGESLGDVGLHVMSEVLRTGRFGIFVDLPSKGGGRPYWVLCPPEVVINWRTAFVGGDPDQLVQVILHEFSSAPDKDGFGHIVEETYRELALVEGVKYAMRVWRKSDPSHVVSTSQTPWTAGEWIVPTRRGKSLNFIPFTFCGPSGVTSDVAKPPLEDLADVVIGHFRNSADHEYGLRVVALPTPWASGWTQAKKTGAPLKIGPSVCWMLEKDGKAGMLEFSGAGLKAIREAMAAKEKMMSVLGGKLLLEEPHGQGPETATAARLRYSAESASLRTIAGAVSAAMTRALRWHVWWTGIEEKIPTDVSVRLNEELFVMKASPEEIRSALFAVQEAKMSFKTFYRILEKGGWTREGIDAKAEQAEIDREEKSEGDDYGAGED